MIVITRKRGVTEKGLELINVDPEQVGRKREALLHTNGALDRVGEVLGGLEPT